MRLPESELILILIWKTKSWDSSGADPECKPQSYSNVGTPLNVRMKYILSHQGMKSGKGNGKWQQHTARIIDQDGDLWSQSRQVQKSWALPGKELIFNLMDEPLNLFLFFRSYLSCSWSHTNCSNAPEYIFFRKDNANNYIAKPVKLFQNYF